MPQRHTCADCGRLSPLTDTAHALISKEFGWRLLRETLPDGATRLAWRCPACWARRKQRLLSVPSAPESARVGDDLTRSGEHSRWLLDEEATPVSSRRNEPEPPSQREPDSRGLPRKPRS